MYQLQVKHDPYLGIHVDSFLLTTDDSFVMIDGGLFGQHQLVEECMKNRQSVLLSTHGHWDHIGMHKSFQDMGGRVLAHIGDKPYFEDHDWHWQELFGQFAGDFDLPPARREIYLARVGSPMQPEYVLQDGKTVQVGEMSFRVIAIPGHSLGSVCFLEENSGALFTGDGLIGHGFFTGTPQYMNVPQYISSMEKLQKIDCEEVYSDHNPPMSGKKLAQMAQEGIDCCIRIDRVVKDYVDAHSVDSDLELGKIIRAIGEAEGRGVGAGTCVTALAHLETISDPPQCVQKCLSRYIHGI